MHRTPEHHHKRKGLTIYSENPIKKNKSQGQLKIVCLSSRSKQEELAKRDIRIILKSKDHQSESSWNGGEKDDGLKRKLFLEQ